MNRQAQNEVDNPRKGTSRRDVLRQLSSLSLSLPLTRALALATQDAKSKQTTSQPSPDLPGFGLSPQDDEFLGDLEHASFLFFWEQANPQTGLIKDRCNVRTTDQSLAASIASTGFGLTAICIGEQRGFISRATARLRVVQTLSFLWHKLPTHRGFFFPFRQLQYR